MTFCVSLGDYWVSGLPGKLIPSNRRPPTLTPNTHSQSLFIPVTTPPGACFSFLLFCGCVTWHPSAGGSGPLQVAAKAPYHLLKAECGRQPRGPTENGANWSGRGQPYAQPNVSGDVCSSFIYWNKMKNPGGFDYSVKIKQLVNGRWRIWKGEWIQIICNSG